MKATKEMIAAGAEAARKYMEEAGGNNPAVIWDAMWAAQPKEPEQSDVVSGKTFDRIVALNESNAARVLELEEKLEALAQPEQAPACKQSLQVEQEPVAIHQFRSPYSSDWYDGIPDHHDGHGPYEVRTLYTHPPVPTAQTKEPEQPKVRTGDCLLTGVCASEGHKIAPQRKPLAYVDLRRIANQCGLGANEVSARTQATVDNFARAIEAAHGIKEKNT